MSSLSLNSETETHADPFVTKSHGKQIQVLRYSDFGFRAWNPDRAGAPFSRAIPAGGQSSGEGNHPGTYTVSAQYTIGEGTGTRTGWVYVTVDVR